MIKLIQYYFYTPVSEACREVANSTERKNPHTPVYKLNTHYTKILATIVVHFTLQFSARSSSLWFYIPTIQWLHQVLQCCGQHYNTWNYCACLNQKNILLILDYFWWLKFCRCPFRAQEECLMISNMLKYKNWYYRKF